MHSGSELIETWVPKGGFRITRCKLQTRHYGIVVADCLVPRWENAELISVHPCEAQPCLHRLFAECRPDSGQFVNLASNYGLLSSSVTRRPTPGEIVPASILSPEPIEIWGRVIRELHSCAVLWDTIRVGCGGLGLARQGMRLAAKLAENFARLSFSLNAKYVENGIRRFELGYRPPTLAAALWQRFAEEVAGTICCARCPAPHCGRWFLIDDATRSDKRYCSGACRSRIFRHKVRYHEFSTISGELF